MFYLINKETYDILDSTSDEKQIYHMIIKNLQRICKGAVSQTVEFDYIDEEGAYFTKKDNDVELRFYTTLKGYIYDKLDYEYIGNYTIKYYDEHMVVHDYISKVKQGIKCNSKLIKL